MYRIIRYCSTYQNNKTFLLKNHKLFYKEIAGYFNNNIPDYIVNRMKTYCNKNTNPNSAKFFNTIPSTELANACDNQGYN
jgi:hypothetical protein